MTRQLNIVAVLLFTGRTLLFGQNFWQSTGGPSQGSVAAIVSHPDGSLFAGTAGGGVFKSTNGGNSWVAWNGQIPSLNIFNLTVTPAGTLLAGTDGGLFRLPNQGTVWFQTNLSGQQVRSVAARSNTEIYAGVLGLGVHKSTDGGVTWNSTPLDVNTPSSFAFNAALGFVLAATDNGVFLSPDAGVNWNPVNNGLTSRNVLSIVVTPIRDIYAGTDTAGIFKSTNNGTNWFPADSGVSNPTVLSLTFNGLGHVFAGTLGGVFRSTNGGTVWRSINPGLSDPVIRTLVPNATGILFAGGGSGNGIVFRTVESTVGTFTVVQPNGGEDWQIGSAQQIQWTSVNISGKVRIELTRNAGASYTTLVDSTVNSGTFPFTVSGPATTQARVRVSSYVDPVLIDSSNALFSISAVPVPTITVVSPNGGENWQTGTMQSILWSSANVTGKVMIELSRNGGTNYSVITDSTDNTGTFTWVVTGPATTTARVRITSIVTSTTVDVSDNNFTIAPPPFVTVLRPNGGEVWQIAGFDTIRWASGGVTGNARIEISRDGGTTFAAIDSNVLNSGTYAWRVTPPRTTRALVRVMIPQPGLPGIVDTSDNVFAISALSVAAPDTVISGSSPAVAVQPPANYATILARLFIRNGGKTAYDSLDMTRVGLDFRAAIPPAYINIRGVEFYVLLSDGQAPVTYPDSVPALLPAVIRVQVQNAIATTPFQRRTYKMVSVPIDLTDRSITRALVDDYGSYNRSKWRVFKWEGAGYVEFPNIAATITPGNAFWLITHAGTSFDVDEGLSVSTRQPQVLTIPPGWSQIANPFAFRVDWDSVAGGNLLSGPYYYDRGAFRATTVRVLQPWEGYFVYNANTQAITIAVPTVEADSLLQLASDWPEEGSYGIRFSASAAGSGLADAEIIIGFTGNSTASCIHPEPPIIADEFVRLSVVDGSQRQLVSLKQVPEEGTFWDMKLSTTLQNRDVLVRLAEHGQLPLGFEMYVLDRDNAAMIPVQAYAFSLYVRTLERSLRVIIGTKKFAEEHNDDIPLVPLQYDLSQNYPNPFNPETKIRYQLSKRSLVSLEIFNIVGQRVRTLVDREQTTGVYELAWDGANDAGRLVSSGVYMYRLQAGASTGSPGDRFTVIRKMVLIH